MSLLGVILGLLVAGLGLLVAAEIRQRGYFRKASRPAAPLAPRPSKPRRNPESVKIGYRAHAADLFGVDPVACSEEMVEAAKRDLFAASYGAGKDVRIAMIEADPMLPALDPKGPLGIGGHVYSGPGGYPERADPVTARRTPPAYLTTDPDGIGDLMTLDDWEENVRCGMFTPDDGTGYPATVNGYDRNSSCWNIPEWATHVMWFNK